MVWTNVESYVHGDKIDTFSFQNRNPRILATFLLLLHYNWFFQIIFYQILFTYYGI